MSLLTTRYREVLVLPTRAHQPPKNLDLSLQLRNPNLQVIPLVLGLFQCDFQAGNLIDSFLAVASGCEGVESAFPDA